MESLNNIPQAGNFGDIATKLNDNFNKLNIAVETVKSDYIPNKGYFASLASLQTSYPSPEAGDTAYVANTSSSTGYYIYNVVNGVWTASTVEAPPVSVPINDYAKHGYTGTPKTLMEVEDLFLTPKWTTATYSALGANEKKVADAVRIVINTDGMTPELKTGTWRFRSIAIDENMQITSLILLAPEVLIQIISNSLPYGSAIIKKYSDNVYFISQKQYGGDIQFIIDTSKLGAGFNYSNSESPLIINKNTSESIDSIYFNEQLAAISSTYAKQDEVLYISEKTYSEAQKNQIRLNSLSEGSFISAKRKEIFGFENLLTDVIKGYSTGSGFVVAANIEQAMSNYIPVLKNEIIAIQGFHPQFSYYISCFDIDKQPLGIGQSDITFINFTQDLTCGYYNVPDNDSIKYVAITLYRSNNIFIDGPTNSTTRQFPFDINSAIIAKISSIDELPFTTKFTQLFTHGINTIIDEKIAPIQSDLTENTELLIRKEDIEEEGTIAAGFIDINGGIITTFPEYCHKTYSVDETKEYVYSAKVPGGGTIHIVTFFNSNDELVGIQREYQSLPVDIVKELIVMPAGTTTIKISGKYSIDDDLKLFERVDIPIYVADVEDRVIAVEDRVVEIENKLSQNIIEFTKSSDEFLVRSSFDDTRDLVIIYKINYLNENVTPFSSHLGLKTQTTNEIRATAYVHNTYDSTPPILTGQYHNIYGEHGWLIPKITSIGHNKTIDDIGSLWETANGKQFKLVKISGDTLYFFPRIIANGGGEGIDTQDYYLGDVLTELSHVSGAANVSNIVITDSLDHQLLPVSKNVAKKFFCDGVEVTENKVYYCNELKVIDVHEGIDPKTITNFDAPDGNSLVRFTFTYIFNGLNCFITHTIEPLASIWLVYYPAMQPLGLRTNGDYKPMIFIPKVKPKTIGEITTDWRYPQDCGETGENVDFHVDADSLINVDDIPERVIQYHKKTGVEDYLIGFAAGFSLISSSSVSSIRKTLSLDALSLARDVRNKYYPRVLHQNAFGSIMSVGDVFNFNYYYSYFNPSLNKSKVYWYKESSNYVIYIHAHELITGESIKLPDFLDGKTVQIVEKTAGASLLTDTISNNSLIVSFTNDANYIVLKVV